MATHKCLHCSTPTRVLVYRNYNPELEWKAINIKTVGGDLRFCPNNHWFILIDNKLVEIILVRLDLLKHPVESVLGEKGESE